VVMGMAEVGVMVEVAIKASTEVLLLQNQSR
jgi:hypothetical protein